MVVFCLIAAIRERRSSARPAINLARAGIIFTMCFAICEMVVIISGGIDVSFPAVGCVAMYVPLYMNYHEMGPDNLFFLFRLGHVYRPGVRDPERYSGLYLEAAAHAGHRSVASGGLVISKHPRVYNAAQPPSEPVYEINMITYTAPSTGFISYLLTKRFLVPVILCAVMALVMNTHYAGPRTVCHRRQRRPYRVFQMRRLRFFAYIFCGVVAGATAMIYTT